MRTIATTAAAVAALALLAAGGASSSASTLPGSSSGTAAAAKFSGCLVTNTDGIHRSFNKVAWQGMQAAAAAEPSKIQVRFLPSTEVSDYVPNIDAFVAEECGLIVTVGPSSPMAQATELSAKANPKVNYAIVDCSSQSHCLTGKKLKNLVSVKGTASAVKTLVLARANGS
jgi:basic membrane protein A and related proteins